MSDMTEALAERIIRKANQPDVLDFLGRQLQPTDLQSLLLSVYDQRSKRLSATDVWRRAAHQPQVHPSPLDLRTVLELDRLILDAVDVAFEAVELSPLCPFGLNTAVTNTSQKKIVSTVRNNEVVSDLGTALALEACNRRVRQPGMAEQVIRLCTSHRAVRAQSYPKHLGFTPHFRIFGMLSADNRNNFNHRFVGAALFEHIRQYLLIFTAANRQGYCIRDLVVTIADVSITEALMARHDLDRGAVQARTLGGDGRLFGADAPFATTVDDVDTIPPEVQKHYGIGHKIKRLAHASRSFQEELQREFPSVRIQFALDRIGGIGHYKDVCFKIDGLNAAGRSFPLVDGGTTDWMAKMLTNGHERCMVSGVGTELFCREYRSPLHRNQASTT
jgi:hypothetical protein